MDIILVVEHHTSGGRVLPQADEGKVIGLRVDGQEKPPKWTDFNRWCKWLMAQGFQPQGFQWITKAGPGLRRRKCTYHKEDVAMQNEAKLMELASKALDRYPALTSRPQAAAELVRHGHVQPVVGGRFQVRSQTTDEIYTVDTEAGSCTCYDYSHNAPEINGAPMCKHRLAALMYLKLTGSAPDPGRIAREQKRIDTQVAAARAGVPILI